MNQVSESRRNPGWVSLCLAPLEQAVEDFKELTKTGIIVDGHCTFTELTWPRGPNKRKLEFIAGTFSRVIDVNELIHFLESDSVEAIINATGVPLNADAIRDKLGIQKHGSTRRIRAPHSLDRKTSGNPTLPGPQNLRSPLPGVPTGLICQEQLSQAEFIPAPKSPCTATPAVPESTISVSATEEYLSGAPAAADPCLEASAPPSPTSTPTLEEPGTK